MEPVKRAYFEIHFAVFLYGFTAILGDLIQLPATILVWWRVLITSISLLFFIQFGRNLHKIPRPLLLRYMGIGILIGLHWITFFGSVKYANASVAMICYATTAFFASILEPLLTDKKLEKVELLLGFLVIPGMVLIGQSVPRGMWFGIALGLLSAILIACFAIYNKKLVNKADPTTITFIEMVSSLIFISCFLPLFYSYSADSPFLPTPKDWMYLLILSLFCTTLAFVLNLRALKYISAFTSTLIGNLEVLYGIALAIIILQENKELSFSFYIGALIVLLSVFGHPFLMKKGKITSENG